MDEKGLLMFRCGEKEYGVPVENVIGIIGDRYDNPLPIPKEEEQVINLQGESIPILNMQADLPVGSNKLTLLMTSNDVQIAIMIDEVIKVIEKSNINDSVSGTNIATFKIWQFPQQVESSREEEIFLPVAFADKSDSVRKGILEQTFFHDIINTAGALKGIVELLKDEVSEIIRPEVEFVEEAFASLVEEIKSQKYMMDAENKQLVLQLTDIDSLEELKAVSNLYKGHDVTINRIITLDDHCINKRFYTDQRLLRRILGNMVKNALESTDKGGVVTLGCCLDDKNEFIKFWVHNDKYIDDRLQKLIFHRSFSTKGPGRGLGTYCMKLFGEIFLNGEVNFLTSKDKGTTFYIKLPL